jgi:hypothetical protein
LDKGSEQPSNRRIEERKKMKTGQCCCMKGWKDENKKSCPMPMFVGKKGSILCKKRSRVHVSLLTFISVSCFFESTRSVLERKKKKPTQIHVCNSSNDSTTLTSKQSKQSKESKQKQAKAKQLRTEIPPSPRPPPRHPQEPQQATSQKHPQPPARPPLPRPPSQN